jgi:ATP-dependent Clp protease ATP-binding subunit ClpC
MDASNILKPALARGVIQCVGATTLDEYRDHIEKDGALVRRFQNVIIDPPTTDQSLNILHNIKSIYEKHHKVKYTNAAIEACVKLADRYITDRENPDKAIDIMDEAGAKAQVNEKPSKEVLKLESRLSDIAKEKKHVIAAQKYEDAAELRDKERRLQSELEDATQRWHDNLANNYTEVDEDDIAQIVSKMTGIPVTKVDMDQIKKLNSIDSELKSVVIGQDDAIDQIVSAVKRSRVGVNRPNKPIGSFMFIGSTGVGKTHLAKQLAKSVFGSEDNLIRLDMSEYGEKHSTSRMMGAPPGYVGYEEGGQLTEQVRRKPYSVVLFDEIEKAHPDIFNTLLQVLDEGRLTDGLGRTVNFRNTIIIMTSNVGSRRIQEFGSGVGFDTVAKRENSNDLANGIIYSSLKKKFAPEFLNRIDDIILFKALDIESIKKMSSIPISEAISRVKDLGYDLKVTSKMVDFICEAGWDSEMGARPLNRAIQKYIEDLVSQFILDGKANPGDTLKIGIQKGEPIINVSNK